MAITVVLLGAAYGVAAGVVGPGLLLSGGQTSQVSCSGQRLAVENRTKTGLELRCLPTHAARTDGQGTRPTTPYQRHRTSDQQHRPVADDRRRPPATPTSHQRHRPPTRPDHGRLVVGAAAGQPTLAVGARPCTGSLQRQ